MTNLRLQQASVAVAAITRASMASLSVGDAVELLKAGAARPVPAHRSHERRPTARHGLWLTIRSTATATPPCANASCQLFSRRRPLLETGRRRARDASAPGRLSGAARSRQAQSQHQVEGLAPQGGDSGGCGGTGGGTCGTGGAVGGDARGDPAVEQLLVVAVFC